MKSRNEIRELPHKIMVLCNDDGGQMFVKLNATKKDEYATVVFSDGLGWDHVSVSFMRRCPTWDEMCEIKNMFFRNDETVIQYHPRKDEYVDEHPYCLHLWRWQHGEMLCPPSFMVGRKKGQTTGEAMCEAKAYQEEYERRYGK